MSDQSRPQPGAPVPFGAQIVPPLAGHASYVNSVVCGVLDGRPVAITGGDDSTVRVWDMATHRQIGRPLTTRIKPPMVSPPGDEVRGVAYGLLDDRPTAVAVVGTTIVVWDLSTGQQVGETIEPEPVKSWMHTGGYLWSVCCTRLAGRLIAMTGGFEVRRWDVATGEQIGEPMFGHDSDWIKSIACGIIDGRPAAFSAGEDGAVWVWDLASGEPIGEPLPGHPPMAYGLLGRSPIVVCADDDANVLRVWDVRARRPLGRPLTGHTGRVRAVALGLSAGRLIAVSGDDDQTLHVWDVESCRQIGPPMFDGRTLGWISSVACGTLNGRPVALAASHGDGLVRVWDLDTHRRMGMDAPARFADELPSSWTDPETGDVYDLTGPIVDDEGSPWEYVDFDGFEPIVSEQPVNPHCTFGIRDAHDEYGFGSIVTRRGRNA